MRGAVPPDAPLWSGSELTLASPVAVEGVASATVEGSVVVRGSWKTVVLHECGRCLEELRVSVERPLTLAYVADEERRGVADDSPADADERVLDGRTGALILDEGLREEVLLAVPRYLSPSEDDEGRCTRCGVAAARFRQSQEPSESAADPRWAALRALQAE